MKKLLKLSLQAFALSFITSAGLASTEKVPAKPVSAATVKKQVSKKVDDLAIADALKTLLVTAKGPSEADAKLVTVAVTGKTIKEMLTSYAEVSKNHDIEEVVVLTRSSAADLPSADDGIDIVALAKNTDAAGFAADVYFEENNSDKRKSLVKQAQAALFTITKAGGLVGVESHSWSVCGTQFPGVFVLNPNTKQVFSIVPAITEC